MLPFYLFKSYLLNNKSVKKLIYTFLGLVAINYAVLSFVGTLVL